MRGKGTSFVTIRLLLPLSTLLVTCTSTFSEQLPIKTYTTADGLAHNTVNRIVRDSRGFLWFCTREGLSRFDGYSFTNYAIEQGLPSASVNDLLETREGSTGWRLPAVCADSIRWENQRQAWQGGRNKRCAGFDVHCLLPR